MTFIADTSLSTALTNITNRLAADLPTMTVISNPEYNRQVPDVLGISIVITPISKTPGPDRMTGYIDDEVTFHITVNWPVSAGSRNKFYDLCSSLQLFTRVIRLPGIAGKSIPGPVSWDAELDHNGDPTSDYYTGEIEFTCPIRVTRSVEDLPDDFFFGYYTPPLESVTFTGDIVKVVE